MRCTGVRREPSIDAQSRRWQVRIAYIPSNLCVELKSLKLYINAFRSVKIFHEHVVNRILEDLVQACDPIAMDIEGDFNIRGNIKTVIRASYRRK